MKLDLSNLELRAYKKKNGTISLNLRTRLLIHTDLNFSLTAYQKKMNGWITLPNQKKVEAKSMFVTVECYYSENIMIHDLNVKFEVPKQKLLTSIAKLKLMFDISFTGHPYEKSKYFINKQAVIVPIYS